MLSKSIVLIPFFPPCLNLILILAKWVFRTNGLFETRHFLMPMAFVMNKTQFIRIVILKNINFLLRWRSQSRAFSSLFKSNLLAIIMKSHIIAVFKKEEEIKKITEKLRKYSFDELDKHPHFEFSVMEKMTNISKIKEIYPKFELVKSIELRENEKGQKYYSLNYELDDGTLIVISLVLEREKPLIINAFYVNRSYKEFEKSLRKNYSRKFI